MNLKGFWGQLKLLTSACSGLAKKVGDLLLLDWSTKITKKMTDLVQGLNKLDNSIIKVGAGILGL